MPTPMLTLTDLRKSFGPIQAVDGVSLEIHRGEVFGLLGPNGAGKSTTIAMIIGVLKPDSGTIDLAGGNPADPAVRSKIGAAPQSLAVYDDLTGRENLEFFGRLFGLAGARLRERVDACLVAVGLADRQKDLARGYSGGMKRRLNLAAALIHDPELILLDEPTAGVDPQSRSNIIDMVQNLAKSGKTVVYTTHYMEEAQKLCDRTAIIDHGKVLALGAVDDLVRDHGGDALLTIRRTVNGEAKDDIKRTSNPVDDLRMAMAGTDVVGVRIDRPDLESVFLSLTGRTLRD